VTDATDGIAADTQTMGHSQRYSRADRDAAQAWVAYGTTPPDDVLAQRVGELAVLMIGVSATMTPQEQLAAIVRAEAQLISPASELARRLEEIASAPPDEITIRLERLVMWIRSVYGNGEYERIVTERDAARARGEGVVFQRPPGWFAVYGAVALVCLLITSIVDQGSGWRVVLSAGSAIFTVLSILWLVRRPRLMVDREGVSWRRLLVATHVPWNQVWDAALEEASFDAGIMKPSHFVRLSYSREKRVPPKFQHLRISSFGREPDLILHEIRATGDLHGVSFSAVPYHHAGTWVGFAGTAAVGLLVVLMAWGFGLCRYGGCGEGAIIAYLDTRTDPSWVEQVIEDEYDEDAPDVEVDCPESVPNDPSRTFRCDVSGYEGVSTVSVKFRSREHDRVSFQADRDHE
jgi:hypothetical protein